MNVCELTWWFKIIHGIAGIGRRRRLCMERGEKRIRNYLTGDKPKAHGPEEAHEIIFIKPAMQC